MKVLHILLITMMVLILSACESDENATLVKIDGRILDTSVHNTPIRGLHVALASFDADGLLDSALIMAETFSDDDGNFSLEYDLASLSNAKLYVNEHENNAKYSSDQFTVNAGDSNDKTFKLYRNATLTVQAGTCIALGADDRFCVSLPGVEICEEDSLDAIVTTHVARGNFINYISATLKIDTSYTIIEDSVYCPAGQTTIVDIHFE